MTASNDSLIEQLAGAYRSSGIAGEVQAHRAFYDLDEAGRRQAYERSLVLRPIEAALDPEGFSSTVRAVLGQISGAESAGV
jgi:hypothetical protein